MLLNGKLIPPRVAPAFVDRPRLYRRLNGWTEQRAIAIYAPAGYGKSSLVSRWIDCAGLAKRVAWLSLDEHDDDSRRFAGYLAAALDRVVPGMLAQIRPILEDGRSGPRQALLRLLVALQDNDLPAFQETQPVLLVLDDVHRVHSAAVHELLLTMLEHGPETLRLLLLARRRTELPLARLHARQQVAILSEADLRFTTEEIGAYLLAKGFAPPTDEELAELETRSEGWVTALQLGALALRDPGDVGDLIDTLRGRHGWLAAYLIEEVLERQSPELRRFLLQTSILDAFTAPLCTAVTGDSDAALKLDEIAQADLFLIALDDENGSYRYHHLFQELLQYRLQAETDVDMVAALHRCAAAWLADAGQVEEAVRHHLAAGDEEAAAALVTNRLRRAAMDDPHAAQRLLDLLPEHVRTQSPRLMLDGCFAALIYGSKKLKARVQEAERILQARQIGPETAPALYAEWQILQGGVCLQQDDEAGASACVEEARPYAAHLDDSFTGTLEFLQMHILRYTGQPEAWRRSAERALAAFQRADFRLGVVALQRELARGEMTAGRSQAATHRFKTLVATSEQRGFGVCVEIALVCCYAAKNSYWQNQLDQARAYLQTALALAERIGNRDLIRFVRYMGAVHAWHADAAEAIPDDLYAPVNGLTSQGISRRLIELETLLLAAGYRRSEAKVRAERLGLPLNKEAPHARLRRLVPFLRAYLAWGERPAGLTDLLTAGIAHCAAIGNRFDELQLLALQTWQRLLLEDEAGAMEAAHRAVGLARETGYARVVLYIPEVAHLVRRMEAQSGSPLWDGSKAALTSAAGLTAQEQRVLELLAADYTYRQISEELVISINTVRTYVKNIYRKLNVKRRDQAVAAAQRRGWLDATQEPIYG